MENLSDFYIQKAKIELNETAARKEQSIKQFYEWLSKHPFITKCEVEPFQIVHILRARKYNMDKTYESFTKLILLTENLSELLDIRNFEKVLKIFEKGPILVMKNRDTDGRKIVIFRHKIFEDLNVNFIEIIKLNHLFIASLLDEPETQICGIISIHDLSNVSMNFIKIIDMNILAKVMSVNDSSTARFKQTVIFGLPALANSFIELVKSFMSNKMRSRLRLCKNIEELRKVINVNNLTAEYGGTDNNDINVKVYRQNVEDQALIAIKLFESIKIDEEKLKNYKNEKSFEVVGSFRKLEID